MIGKLKGIVDAIERDFAIIDVGGVGYKLFCSTRLLDFLLTNMGQKVELFVETIVREDQISLLGFQSKSEQECFLKLTTVQGVGNKLALVILAALTPEKIALAIAAGDNKAFSAISGVGPKLTTRILSELKDKNITFEESSFLTDKESGAKDEALHIREDAVSALVNLGINKSEGYTLVTQILSESPDTALGEVIRLALKKSAK